MCRESMVLTDRLYPKYFYVLLQRSGYLSVFLYYISLSLTLLHHPPCISGASGKPRGRVPLPQIKSGEKWLDKKKDSSELHVSILWSWLAWKNSSKYRKVQVFALIQKMLLSERQRVQHFSVSFLAKFCTSWYFRIFDLNQIQRILHMQSLLES